LELGGNCEFAGLIFWWPWYSFGTLGIIASMRALHVIVVAVGACLAGSIGGFLIERHHAAESMRSMQVAIVFSQEKDEYFKLQDLQNSNTNRVIDDLAGDLEGSALYMCSVVDENPQAQEAIDYRHILFLVADYRAKHPRLHSVGTDWDKKVTGALAKTLGRDMPPNTAPKPKIAMLSGIFRTASA
jgi:hypothetical protein